MLFPRPLQPGACVGLIAPSSPITPEEHIACVKVLEHMGYSVLVGRTLQRDKNLYGYLAGDAKERAGDVNEMFGNPQVDAIFCTRGGYGSVQILEYLDYEMVCRNPKIFVGYSDVTSIHTVLQKYCNMVSFHGPMVKPNFLPGIKQEEGKDAEKKEKREAELSYMVESLHAACNLEVQKQIVFQNPPGQEFQVINPGYAQGRLAGGNLSVIVRSLGTSYAPEFKEKILFLEEVGESIPRVHMYLTQMYYAGVFQEVRGVLLGDFTECTNERYDNALEVREFLKEWFSQWKIPVLGNICSDHRNPMGTLPLGAWCEMRIDDERKVSPIRFL